LEVVGQGLLEKLGLVVIGVFVLLNLRLPLHIEIVEAMRQLVLLEKICKFDSAHLFVIVLPALLPCAALVKFMEGTQSEDKP
jgi:hypothetical protein